MLKRIKGFIYTRILRRKYYRVGKCLTCGRCCKRIYIIHGKGVIKNEKEFEELKDLHRFYSYVTILEKDETGLIFSCSKFDKQTSLCKIHSKRPEICRRYPQEEVIPIGGNIYEECGYKLAPIIPFSQILNKKIRKYEKYENMRNTKI